MSRDRGAAFLPADEVERRRARGERPEDRRGAFLVEASAGTGKTTVLVERVLRTVLEDRLPLARIAVVTFTELAAAELKVRLREGLDERFAATAAGDPLRAPLQAALDDLESAAVGTIHAFAADLLRRHPLEAGVDPGFGIADELGQRLRFAEAWEEFLRGLDDPQGLDAAFDLGLESEPQLRGMAWALLEPVRRGAEFPPPLPDPVDGSARLAQVERLLEQAIAVANPQGETRRLILDPARALLGELRRMPESAAAGVVVSLAGPISGKNVGAGVDQRAKQLRNEARDVLNGLRREWGDRRLLTMARWLAGVAPIYLRRLEERSQLDFDQLLERADGLLGRHPAVRRSLRARFPVLLIDEFQDTDRVQTRFLLRLAEEEEGDLAALSGSVAPEGMTEPRCFFVVGDPKQSIYRFRGADVENYRRVIERRGVERLELRQNFRSRPGIVRWVNEVLGRVMPRPSEPVDAWEATYRDLEPKALRSEPEGSGVVYLDLGIVKSDAKTAVSIQAARHGEAVALARFARGLVEGGLQGRFSVRDRGAGQEERWRPARYGDLVLLLPRLTNLAPFEEAFAAEGVPFRVEAGRSYYRRDEVHALLAVLSALADPGDAVAAVTALRGPGFGCADGDLVAYSLVEPAPRFDLEDRVSAAAIERSFDPAAAARVANGLERLADLRRRLVGQPLAAIVSAVLDECALLSHFALDRRGEQRVANLLKAVDLARRLEEQGARSLPGLLATFRALVDEELAEADSPAQEGAHDALRVLTVHAAKGLEFEVVLLGGLAGRSGGSDDRLGVLGSELRFKDYRTPGYDAAYEDDERRQAAERKRLLYVAVTRARDLLVVPWAPAAGLRVSEMQPIHGLLFDEKAGSPGRPRPERGDVVLGPSEWPAREEAGRDRLDLDALLALPRPDLASTRPSPRSPSVARPTAMRAWSLRAHRRGGGDEGAVVPALVRDRAANLGLAVHARLARHLGVSRADERLAGFPAELVAEADRLVGPFLAGDLFRRARRSPTRLVEEPLAAAFGSRVLDGRLDLAFLEDDAWVVVDWKTDKIENRDAAARGAEHAPQLGLYASALEAASGKPVAELRIVFLALGEAADVVMRGEAARRLIAAQREAAGTALARPSA